MNIEIGNISMNIFNIINPIIYIVIGLIIFRIIKKIILKSTPKQLKLRQEQLQKVKTIK